MILPPQSTAHKDSATASDLQALQTTFRPFSGHVSRPSVRTMMIPLWFFTQVSNTHSCVKTSNQCIVQLAYPTSVCTAYMRAKRFLLSLLLLCGDIESNPGFNTEELLRELLDGQKNMQKRLDAIECKLANVEAIAAKQAEVGAHVENMQRTIQSLEKKLRDLEDKSRQNNLVIFGIKEAVDKKPDVLLATLNEEVFVKHC